MKTPPQTRIIKQKSKNNAIGTPKLERELRKSFKNADSSSGSEGRSSKTSAGVINRDLGACGDGLRGSENDECLEDIGFEALLEALER